MARPGVRLRARAGTIGFVVIVELAVAALLVPSSGADLLVTTPRVSIGDVAVVEGDGPKVQMRFTVNLSEATANQVTVGYATTNGTASVPDDFKAKTGTLTFAPGKTSKAVTVVVFGDPLWETATAETLTVTLSNPTGGAVPGRMQGSGTIINDDAVPCVADQYEPNDSPQMAPSLGTVSGDLGAPTIGIAASSCSSGDSDWYQVTVTETAGLVSEQRLSVRIAMAAADEAKQYRIVVYRGGQVQTFIDTSGGQADFVLWWSEALFQDCSATLHIEVRPLNDLPDDYAMQFTGNVPVPPGIQLSVC